MKNYIFGYGSLINLKSLSKTMHKEMTLEDIIPVKLTKFKRVWNLKETIYSELLQSKINGIFLNIETTPTNWINGVIFQVSDSELAYLNARERNYVCVEVSENIIPYKNGIPKNSKILTYIATNKLFIQNESTNQTFVMNNYIELVEQGCAEIGNFFLQDYKLSTPKCKFNRLNGSYSFN